MISFWLTHSSTFWLMDDESLLIGFVHHHQYPAEEKKSKKLWRRKQDIIHVFATYHHLRRRWSRYVIGIYVQIVAKWWKKGLAWAAGPDDWGLRRLLGLPLEFYLPSYEAMTNNSGCLWGGGFVFSWWPRVPTPTWSRQKLPPLLCRLKNM